jgi:hypothetical protein
MPRRSGLGMLLGLVLLVAGILGTMGVASYIQSGGTSRARVRVLGVRSCVEAGDAALAEAAAALRASIDTGATSPTCPDDWRGILLRLIENTPQGQTKLDPAGRTYTLKPVVTRAKIPSEDVPMTIGDVTARVLSCFMPVLTGVQPPNPPQGIIELSVTVRGPGAMFEVKRTVRQRRIFHATSVDPGAASGNIKRESVLLFLTTDPIGTAIE